ncbi:MAG: hypothetical protein ABIV51_14285 [Saprospiraceae bacterium]
MKQVFFLFAAILCFNQVGFAQNDLEVEQIEVVKNFDATLIETEKLNLPAPLLPIDTNARKYKYNIGLNPLNIQYPIPQIRPIAVSPEKTESGYNGFVRAGAGFPIGALAELGYHFDNKSNFFADLYVGHQSANNDKKIQNQRYMENDGRFNFTWITNGGLAINPRIGYSLDDVYFYGYNQDDTTFTKDESLRRFKTLDVGISLFNGRQNDLNLDYLGKVDYYSLKDNRRQSEWGTVLNLGATKWIAEKNALHVDLITDLSTFHDSLGNQTLNNFSLKPSFTIHGDIFQIKLGANLTSSNDKFSIFPDVYGTVKIAGNALQLYALFDGDLSKNSFRALSQINPYIAPNSLQIRNTKKLNLEGGFKGQIVGINYQLGGGFKNMSDLALFVPDTNDRRQFLVLYDTAKVPFASLGISGKPSQKLRVHANAIYQFYQLDREAQAWGLPALQVNAGMNYEILEKRLFLKVEAYYNSGIHNPVSEGSTDDTQLTNQFDISLGVDYYFTEKIGAFIQLNNLANNQYQRWANYPSFGLNARAGIQARF